MPTQNTLDDLRNHLFAQLETLSDKQDPEKLKSEIERAKAVVLVANSIVETAKLELKAADVLGTETGRFFEKKPPQLTGEVSGKKNGRSII